MFVLLTKQGVMILLALSVDSIELSYCSIRPNNLTISQESPNLPKCQSEALLRLLVLYLLSINLVPRFQLTVVS